MTKVLSKSYNWLFQLVLWQRNVMKETYHTAYLQDNFLWSHTGIPLSLSHISLLLRHNFCHRLIGNENIEATYIVSHIKQNSDIASMGYVYILFHTVIDTYPPWTWTVAVTPTSFTIFVNRTAFFILVVATTRLPIFECSWKVDRALLGCISCQVILKYNTYELIDSRMETKNVCILFKI